MATFQRTIVITGGAGFIGSHVVRLFVNKYPEYRIINLDKLTYAGNLANLKDIEDRPNYKFVKMDICDFEAFYRLMQEEKVDGIIHLAAESHVDRSIKDPFTFARTNVMGTLSLLQAAKLYWESLPEKYEGKTVCFKAQVAMLRKDKNKMFAPGRFVMTCCVEDITFIGFKCKYPDSDKIPHKSWIEITAKVKVEFAKEYRGKGPVLYPVEIKPAKKPEDELVYFS